jgi:sugar lactone lactonase YvrE
MGTRLLFIICFFTLSLLKAQIITTVAGNGTNAYTGDGGQATAAELSSPTQLEFDAAGNLYFADEINNVIRKINTAGIISTIAGNGMVGFSGDGGQATNAQLNSPQAITFDAVGNLYISITDQYTGRVRKVNTAGIITTVAGGGAGALGDGGQATAATINPFGITFDTSGNLYIADFTNSRIRKVNTAGIISTIAGNGTVGFNGDGGQATAAALRYPFDVVFDAIGNLYISDGYNHRVRKVNSTGIITTIAGNGTAGYSGDGGQATVAKLNVPNGMAFDASGNLYIADWFDNRIRKVNTVGTITTIAGNGTFGYSGDGGQATAAKLYGADAITLDASMCNLYIADFDNYRIRKVSFPVVATASSATICAGATTNLTASNATNYTWSTGADTNTIIVSPVATTNYTITGSTDGCISKAISTVNVTPTPSLNISGNNNICVGDNTILTASGASNYIWSTGDTTANLFLKPTLSTTYTVIGTTSTCSNIATVTVNVNSAFDFVLPNIVTPNNDNINDFIDFGKFQFSSLQLEIYNRWGVKVFESTNPTCIWKPTEDDGTYFYTLNYIINCNNEKQNKTLKGFVTVIR